MQVGNQKRQEEYGEKIRYQDQKIFHVQCVQCAACLHDCIFLGDCIYAEADGKLRRGYQQYLYGRSKLSDPAEICIDY